ncbi:MAG TPA: lipoyl domain-containing protein [Dermatophilaceae bacterium]|jgi:pyruvate/2-oxoglutarate dehydrogenase complex dihydrolipoamide acyltransferase (E2) component|nr:lipoyl domain-containing protein [Dermatophilaceae bacterium]
MTDVLFPQMSKENPDAEGVVSTWFVADGDQVTAGQLIAEVQVDKVSADLPAPVAGTIHVLVPEEEATKQGAALARIE